MPDAPKLPPLPSHPEPHTYRWTDAELRVIAAYGAECRRLALEVAAQWFLNEDNKRMFHSETLWPHQVAERISAMKDWQPND